MTTCCCCFTLRAGAVMIALISVLVSLPYALQITQAWNDDRFSFPSIRAKIEIGCSLGHAMRFDFAVPVILSEKIGNVVVVLYFICSALLLHGSVMRKKGTCLPWLWLSSFCVVLNVVIAVWQLFQAIFSRSCPVSSKLGPIIGIILAYGFQAHLISSVNNFIKELGIVLSTPSQALVQDTGPIISQTTIVNHNVGLPVSHANVPPEIVIYPNPHDLPPSYDEIIPSAPPPD